MKAQISISTNDAIEIDLDNPIGISIPLKNGSDNPNCYWAEPVKFETIKSHNFVGSIAEGGPVNYQKLQFTPHGNGTHIEGYGHITNSGATINNQLRTYHFYATLISLKPAKRENGDMVLELNDQLINKDWNNIKALIIRTIPNDYSKLTRNYSGTNPPYVSPNLMKFIVEQGIEHLLIDLPSVDKEVDNGALLSHNMFWNTPKNPRKNASITELIYVPSTIPDGNYLLNLQLINLEMDAAPCNPIIYKVVKLITIRS